MPDEAPPARTQIILAFDYGRRRVGIACGDTLTRRAAPQTSVAPDAVGFDTVDGLVRDYKPDVLVVGLPYNADGSEGASAARARDFAQRLGSRYALPVELVDERYSSLEAQERLRGARATGLRKRRVRKGDLDAGAACVILDRWFGERRTER